MSLGRTGKEKQYAIGDVDMANNSQPASVAAPMSATRMKVALFAANRSSSQVNGFCGATAGLASGIATCPLDVIKTKLQAQGGFRPRTKLPSNMHPKLHYHGLFGTASTIVKEDGFLGLYRGLGPMVLGYLPTWATYMTVYSASRDYYYTKFGNDRRWLAQLSASLTAGATSTIITNPIWVVKTRLMSQVSSTAAMDKRTPWHYNSTIDAFRKMFRHEGIMSFYSGLGPALLGLTHVAIQFPLYEWLKFEFTGVQMGESGDTHAGVHTAGVAAATFLSKVCATSMTYPHEVIRTRLQTQQRRRAAALQSDSLREANSGPIDAKRYEQSRVEIPRYRGIVNSVSTILKEEGWHAFYNGMGTNMVRAVPAAMVTMLTFEIVKSAVQRLQEEGREAAKED